MKRALLAVLAFVLLAAPAFADTTYTVTFTCTGFCNFPVPTGSMEVSTANPEIPIFIYFSESWDGWALFGSPPLILDPDLPTDTYTWSNSIDEVGDYDEMIVSVYDVSNGTYGVNSIQAPGYGPNNLIEGFTDTGDLIFSTPEPVTLVLVIIGFMGMLLIVKKNAL
jgi:hypothetical protein